MEGNTYLVLSTGKKIYAGQGIIGLSEEMLDKDDPWIFTYGFDGEVFKNGIDDEGKEVATLTPQERIELAEYMIGLWTKFLEQAKS